jgi:heterotetrameric sarcosine oxidase delta subunit
MALHIECPRCGPRSVAEFSYGEVPDPPAGLDAGALAVDRRFFTANPDGPAVERWFHSAGCRRWLTLRRDRAEP